MALVNVYGFTDSGKKVKVGEYYEAFPVGGRIFYIDSNSTATYKFYDANMVEISNVSVGDTPAYYEVLTEDANGVDKYYVYNPSLVEKKLWGFSSDPNTGIETGATGTSVGLGKTNTSTILALTDTSSSASDNIWTWLKDQRINKLGGCDDWFVGSKDEVEQLRLYLVANADGSTIIDFFTGSYVWTSSEYSSKNVYGWFSNQWFQSPKFSSRTACAIRSM